MPTNRTTPKAKRRAAELRHNQTEAETSSWTYLRAHRANGVHFRRQHAIDNYIVDFCSPRKKVIIELDGGQHIEQEEYDIERTKFFESQGYTVLRFWNHNVLKDIEAVMRAILKALDEGNF